MTDDRDYKLAQLREKLKETYIENAALRKEIGRLRWESDMTPGPQLIAHLEREVARLRSALARTPEGGSMNPGRELDALVAEKVMGLTQCAGGMHGDSFPNSYCYAHPDTPEMGSEVYPYSTDIVAAWEVVEKMWAEHIPRTRYGVYRLQLNRLDTGRYVCEFACDPEGDFSTHSRGEADTAPLAICLAALKAVGA
jgi:hypothetical protein